MPFTLRTEFAQAAPFNTARAQVDDIWRAWFKMLQNYARALRPFAHRLLGARNTNAAEPMRSVDKLCPGSCITLRLY